MSTKISIQKHFAQIFLKNYVVPHVLLPKPTESAAKTVFVRVTASKLNTASGLVCTDIILATGFVLVYGDLTNRHNGPILSKRLRLDSANVLIGKIIFKRHARKFATF